jgi:biotin carboxylase
VSMKKLLIVGAGPDQLPAIKIAKSMGIFVAATDMNPNAVGFPFADITANLSTKDKQGNLKFARDLHVDGVMTLISETGVPTVAHIAANLGLPGPSEETALLATNKNAMHAAFLEHGVDTPRSVAAKGSEDLENFASQVGYPFVVKPSDCSGQSGISVVESPQEIPRALDFALGFSGDGYAIGQELIDGPEINVCAVVHHGQVHILSLSDRVTSATARFGVALRHLCPANLSESQRHAVIDISKKVISAIKLSEGIAYPQILLDENGPKVAEIAIRIPGGKMRELALFASGIDMIKVAINQALGQQVDLEPLRSSDCYPAVVVEFLTRQNFPRHITTLGSVDTHRAAKLVGVKEIDLRIQSGDPIPELIDSRTRFGSIVTVGKTLDHSRSIASEAIKILTSPGYKEKIHEYR